MTEAEIEDERRGGIDVNLDGPVAVTIDFRLGDDEIELDGRVLRASSRTLVVELASGIGTLALATAPECEVLVRAPGVAIRAEARPGRRIDDVPGSRQIELVLLDEDFDLLGLL